MNSSVGTDTSIGQNASVVQDVELTDKVVRKRIAQPGTSSTDYSQFVTHPIKLQHQTWTSATLSSSISSDLVALWKSLLPASMAAKVKNFYYFKATLKLKFVVQGCSFAAGQLVYTFIPHPLAPMIGTQENYIQNANIVNSKIVPHVVIDPSKTATYDLELPICTPNGLWALSSNMNHGSYEMIMWVYNPMISGTAATPSANVCVYMSLVDPEFEGMTTLLSGEFVDEKREGGTLSSIAGTLSDVASMAVPFSGEFAPEITLFSMVTGTLSKVLAFFGFSKPPAVENGVIITNRNCDNYSQKDGKSTSIVLGSSQSQSLALSPEYAGGELSDMSLDRIVSIKGAVIIGNTITTAITAESTLTSWYVDPFSVLMNGANFERSPLAGVANAFNYWCGDIDYTFEFVASVFHRCTVVIAWDPYSTGNNATVYPALSDALNSLQNTTVSISGNTTVTITVPYKQPMPWLHCNFPADITTSLGTFGFTNGRIMMWLLNPLVSNGSTDPIYYNVYVSTRNMRFAGPTADRCNTTYLLAAELVPETLVSFGDVSDLSKCSLRSFGDVPRTVKEATSRMGLYYRGTYTIDATHTSENLTLMNAPVPVTSGTVTGLRPTAMNLLTHFAPCFLGYRGGIRYTCSVAPKSDVLTANDQHSCVVRVAHTIFFNSGGVISQLNNATLPTTGEGAYAWTQPNLQMSSRADWVAPQMLPVDFYPTKAMYTSFYDYSTIQVKHYNVLTGGSTFDITVSTGSADDATFSWFIGFPTSTT